MFFYVRLGYIGMSAITMSDKLVNIEDFSSTQGYSTTVE